MNKDCIQEKIYEFVFETFLCVHLASNLSKSNLKTFKKLKKQLLLLLVCIINGFALSAQSFQLFTEDFESTNAFTLNTPGPGSSSGNNRWTVTNNYTGVPLYNNTMSEDSTYSGSIAFAPHSKYLHIYDSFSGITNANYDATTVSDNFSCLTNGLCTLGMDSVHFIFYYLCEGSANAHGEVYYSINGGPWIQTGQAQYKNKYKWQYEDITDPAFSNQTNLRFGFRWLNGSGTPPSNESFSIDDIDVAASYGSNTGNPVTCTVDSVVPNPVCQGNYIYIYWHLSDTLCDGSYTIQLSNSGGTFPGANAWIFNVYYPQTSGVMVIQLPNTVLPGSCYKIRINRTTPLPAITGIASACYSIIACPNTISTLQPVVTMDTNAVCIGSAIDIPFWSEGVYLIGNSYTAQLSDSNGVFPSSPTIINASFDHNTYSPVLPPYQPGSVSGIVPTVTPGCNYYIRVVSNNPTAIGTPYGPFCIRQCDIETNNNTDLHFCVTDCSVLPLGQNTTIPVGTNTFDSTMTGAVYGFGNIFKSQLMSSMTFAQIGSDGILGHVAATHDTIMPIHAPCKDSLAINPPYGIPLGMNYMRAIATNTTQPDNALGSLVRVTIGATHSVGPSVDCLNYTTFMPQDTFCLGDQIYPEFSPYNYFDNSTYQWIISGFNNGNPFSNLQGANSNNTGYAFNFQPGTYTFSVLETNNGCIGQWGPVKTIVVLGPPSVAITGPNVICLGDTVHYSIPAQGVVTLGVWNSTNSNGHLINSTNTETNAIGQSTGTFLLTVQAVNTCGSASNSRSITVKPYPNANAGNDTTVCVNQPITLSTPTGTGYMYNWVTGGTTVNSTHSFTVNPVSTSTYVVTVSVSGGCKTRDTVVVNVQTPTGVAFPENVCPLGNNPITLAADSSGSSYYWLPGGQTTPSISVNDTGVYSVAITMPGRACARVVTFNVAPEPCPQDLVLAMPNVFSPEGNGVNDFFTPITTGAYADFKVKIYDRWGLLVFESADPFFKWDGTHKGKKCPDGVYYYIVNYLQTGKDSQSQSGFITLIRK